MILYFTHSNCTQMSSECQLHAGVLEDAEHLGEQETGISPALMGLWSQCFV